MSEENRIKAQRYWAKNLRLLMILLAIWWLVS